MPFAPRERAALVVALFVALSTSVTRAHAQRACGEWTPGLFPLDGVGSSFGGGVWAMTTFDDGTGSALYVAGGFEIAGATFARSIAKWNGTSWSPLGSGLSGTFPDSGVVNALAVFDDGTGVALYAGGGIDTAGGVPVNHLAKWNGTSWSDVGGGVDAEVDSLAVFDDGSGPALFVGGVFQHAGGLPAQCIAKWDGQAWSPLADDFPGSAYVRAMILFDDGQGPALYAGGDFLHSRLRNLNHVARWNGSAWSALGTGIDDCCQSLSVFSFATFDDGRGPALFVGGTFAFASGVFSPCLARWNGSEWSTVGGGLTTSAPYGANALAVFDDGTGPALFAGGLFSAAGGTPANNIAKWNGTSWSALGLGLTEDTTQNYARSLIVFDSGSGPALFAAGWFRGAGDQLVNAIARWDGSRWSKIESGTPGRSPSGGGNALGIFDDGAGPALYIGSDAQTFFAPLVPKRPLVKWTGTSWTELPSMDGDVRALMAFDDGSGQALYVGGTFSTAGGVPAAGIARWNGMSFSDVGGGFDGDVHSLEVFDDGTGPALYAGGPFTQAGGVSAQRIARWNGVAWSPIGGGFPGSASSHDSVDTLTTFDDGNGIALYAGGQFRVSRGAPANQLARWNGTSWSDVGGGTDGRIRALAAVDDGRGPALFAAGSFLTAGSTSVLDIARWNGTSWSELPGIVNVSFFGLRALVGFDDGNGPALYVGGDFSDAGGVAAANNVARFRNGAWSSLGSGTDRYVSALGVYDDGTGAALYATGLFVEAGNVVSSGVAQWKGSRGPARRGNVNAAAGSVRDVLFVNGSAGDAERVVSVTGGAPIDVRLDHAPNGPLVAPYVLWAWPGPPTHAVEIFRGESRIGCLVNPTPFNRPLGPQPVACLRSPGIPTRACRGVGERTGPAAAPFTLHLTRGFRASATITFQGILRDDFAPNASGYSVTNATVVESR
ncbi:MAG: hypothetical protein HY292_06560 [Planctomycetes bacterium]|nr:hypothetical protein [Planctomycetota bacterium]